jgi:cytidylate kinase
VGFVIAIDGPAASGKGAIATRLGALYGLPVLDTGLLYRAVGAIVLQRGGDPDDPRSALAAAEALDPSGLEGESLRGAEIAQAASRQGTRRHSRWPRHRHGGGPPGAGQALCHRLGRGPGAAPMARVD